LGIDILAVSQASFTAINRTIYSALKSRGWNIHLVAPAKLIFSGRLSGAEPEQPGDPQIHFLKLNGNNPRIQWYKGLIQTLDSLKPQIVYLDNDPASFMATRIGIWCRFNNAKLVCQSCENLSIKIGKVYQRQGLKGIPAALMKNIFSLVSKKLSSHVFVISNDGADVFKDLGYNSVSKTPLGFNENIFFVDDDARNRIRKEKDLDTITFAYFGRLVPEKGIHIMLEALSRIKDLKWKLLMDDFEIYANPYTEEIKQQIGKLKIQDRVIYFHASHTGIAAYMNAADVVLLPSISTPVWKEQYGRVVPEAMACGKILVVSATGALPELVAEAGITFPEKNIEELVKIMRDIILNPDNYKKYNSLAYERAHNYLGIKSQTEIMNNKFVELSNR
jgi:glycosyltransferase involved in cell wall biosynthesis